MRLYLLIIVFVSTVLYSQNHPYVILISFDGFRWDYSERNITPNLNNIKNQGVHALSLRPSFPTKTFPNHYSIISGMYPENHGLIFNSFIDPVSKSRYRLGDSSVVRDSKWYLGEAFWETAERNGIKTASYFWPGSEMNLDYRRPTYYEKYEHNRPYKERVDGVLKWLKLPFDERPHFITLYFDDTDTYGHKYGPNSTQINNSIRRLDSLIGYFREELKVIDLVDSTNIIIVSDHGMTEISTERVVNVEELLCGFDVKMDGTKPVMMIQPSDNEFDDVYKKLKGNEYHYTTYTKQSLPAYFHFNCHPYIYPIILVADLGWSLVTDKWFHDMEISYSAGNHGYNNNHTDMHGVFIADGPSFKENFKTGTLWNIDIYPLLCKLFGIQPRSNIDGTIERIGFILK